MVAAVVLAHDGWATLPAVLDGIEAQTRPPDGVVVVDNASSDGTAAGLAGRGGVEVLRLPVNRGVGAGHNAGWEAVLRDPEVDWVWVLEHDAVPEATCLASLLETVGLADREVYPLGALIPLQGRTDAEVRRLQATASALALRERAVATPNLHFNGCLLRASAVREAGQLREDFFVGHEDREYGWRLATLGWLTMVDRTAVVLHPNAGDRTGPRDTLFRRYYSWRNDFVFRVQVRGGGILEALAIIAGTWRVLVRAVRERDPRRLQARLWAMRDAYRGSMGEKDYPFLRR